MQKLLGRRYHTCTISAAFVETSSGRAWPPAEGTPAMAQADEASATRANKKRTNAAGLPSPPNWLAYTEAAAAGANSPRISANKRNAGTDTRDDMALKAKNSKSRKGPTWEMDFLPTSDRIALERPAHTHFGHHANRRIVQSSVPFNNMSKSASWTAAGTPALGAEAGEPTDTFATTQSAAGPDVLLQKHSRKQRSSTVAGKNHPSTNTPSSTSAKHKRPTARVRLINYCRSRRRKRGRCGELVAPRVVRAIRMEVREKPSTKSHDTKITQGNLGGQLGRAHARVGWDRK